MKKPSKILLSALCLLSLILSTKTKAQTTPVRHLTYKGIPITGSVGHFHNELERKGFTAVKDDKDAVAYHKGVFASYRVKVTTLFTPLSNTIYGTYTYLDEHGLWKEIQTDFDTFKYHLTEVYGEPSSLKEEFQGPYIKGDGYSIKALSEGKVNFKGEWNLDNGTIRITVIQTSQGLGCLLIEYMDKENLALKEKELTTIIRNDL